MKLSSISLGLASVVLAAAMPAQAALDDAGFESALGSAWSTSGSVARSSDDAYSGSWSLLLADADASATYSFSTGIAVSAISELSLYVKSASGPLNYVVFGYSDGSSGTSYAIDDLGGSSDWEQFSLLADLGTGKTLTSLTLYGNSGASTFIDDIALVTAVPEPATWAMFGAGALLLAARRRRGG